MGALERRRLARRGRRALLLLLLGACGLLAGTCWTLLAPQPEPGGPRPRPGPPPRTASVLLWWEPFTGGPATRPPPDCLRLFGIGGCRALTERSDYPAAEAVLLHHWDAARASCALPGHCPAAPRPPGQLWVWMNFESPTHSSPLVNFPAQAFNWTLSYRADSDVFVPYGRLRPRRHAHDPPAGPAPPLARKRALLAWVVSHWDELHARVRYYRQLQRHVPVDVFGRSGHGRPLPRSGLLHTVARYKFYLAFENSQHSDYITEKLWRNALQAGAVPVVLGPPRANYERFLPRRAFIHVDDFRSTAALAAYLRFLDRHPSAYLRHFHWRRSHAVRTTALWDEPWCLTCQAVQLARGEPGRHRDLTRWFWS
ncbi:alpha-(1,3)-fucosyltransferase 4 [Sorex araneus]|uniref:alpha-(1,3)-fucosyltransferase 4 n=1 Tax=Sorex araneus TaxID=42254 RepID=UPI002433C8BF|nr:alpha-(1,3)-fucosyltransferase 4 [Sorex araneus]